MYLTSPIFNSSSKSNRTFYLPVRSNILTVDEVFLQRFLSGVHFSWFLLEAFCNLEEARLLFGFFFSVYKLVMAILNGKEVNNKVYYFSLMNKIWFIFMNKQRPSWMERRRWSDNKGPIHQLNKSVYSLFLAWKTPILFCFNKNNNTKKSATT